MTIELYNKAGPIVKGIAQLDSEMGYIAKAYSYIEKKETVDIGLDPDDTSFSFRVQRECAKNVLDIIKGYIYDSKQRLLEELRNI